MFGTHCPAPKDGASPIKWRETRWKRLPGWSRFAEKDAELPDPPPATDHYHEFIDSVKSRELTSCDVAYAQKINIAAHLGNISLRVGEKVHWDDNTKSVVDNEEANRLVGRKHRPPWGL